MQIIKSFHDLLISSRNR